MKISIRKLKERAIEEIKLDADLILLSTLSGLIAAYGIKIDSIFVLIGAMLVAPFFDPIISVVVLMLTDMKGSLRKVFFALFLSFLVAFLSSSVFWIIQIYFLGFQNIVSSEPALLIDNFMIALLMGFIGILLWVFPKGSNASAGLAIAVALVPPLAYSTFFLVNLQLEMFFTYFEVFVIYLVGIMIGSFMGILVFRKNRKLKLVDEISF